MTPGALTISSAFSRAAARCPSRVAIRFNRRDLTYAELERESARLANALLGPGRCRPGDRVGLLIGNRPEFLVGVLAAARAGLVVVPLPAGSTARELTHLAAHSGMRVLLVSGEPGRRLGDALEELAGSGIGVHGFEEPVGASPTVAQVVAGVPPAPVDLADEVAPFFFGYTSGTTGRPKAAVVGHRARTLLALMYGQEYGCYAGDEVHLITTPMYHGAGLGRALAPLLTGGSIELHERFDPEHVLCAIAAGRVTATFMVPTMFASIFELPQAALARHPGALRTVLSNASALPEHFKHRILEQWPGVRLFEIYGSTETGTISSLRPEDQLRKPRCVGLPLAMTSVRVLDEDACDVATGEVGKLYASSPYLFSGYHDDPAATEAVTRDGHVTAGDLARRDDEGYLYIVGRATDVIVSGGVNVYPREVEEFLAEHVRVREAIVVGMPDQYWGEVVHAVVVPAPDAPKPTPDELIAHCRAGLAAPKVPKRVSVRDSLPRTSTGKVVKRELIEDLARGTDSEVDARTGRVAPGLADQGETTAR